MTMESDNINIDLFGEGEAYLANQNQSEVPGAEAAAKEAQKRYKAGEQMMWRDPRDLPPGMSGYIETYPLTREAFIAGASWAVGEKWISVDEYEEVVQGKLSDKPVIKMLNQENIKFKDWKTNIHDLVDKEMGAIREVRVKLPTPPIKNKGGEE